MAAGTGGVGADDGVTIASDKRLKVGSNDRFFSSMNPELYLASRFSFQSVPSYQHLISPH